MQIDRAVECIDSHASLQHEASMSHVGMSRSYDSGLHSVLIFSKIPSRKSLSRHVPVGQAVEDASNCPSYVSLIVNRCPGGPGAVAGSGRCDRFFFCPCDPRLAPGPPPDSSSTSSSSPRLSSQSSMAMCELNDGRGRSSSGASRDSGPSRLSRSPLYSDMSACVSAHNAEISQHCWLQQLILCPLQACAMCCVTCGTPGFKALLVSTNVAHGRTRTRACICCAG